MDQDSSKDDAEQKPYKPYLTAAKWEKLAKMMREYNEQARIETMRKRAEMLAKAQQYRPLQNTYSRKYGKQDFGPLE